MPGQVQIGTLRVDPSAIPALRAAFDASLDELSAQLVRLGNEGYIPEPWMGDPVSAGTARAYNLQVMEAADGSYAAMVAFEAELLRIRDSLQAMEDHYRQVEGENAALWGRL